MLHPRGDQTSLYKQLSLNCRIVERRQRFRLMKKPWKQAQTSYLFVYKMQETQNVYYVTFVISRETELFQSFSADGGGK